MQPSKRNLTPARKSGIVQILAGALFLIASLPVAADPAASESRTKVEPVAPAKPEPLSGVELWAMNCSRCHAARNPGEFTAQQWRTIIRHMRVRANLPAAQVRELQKYLESGAGK
jgi:cytochrome c5